MAEIGLVRYDAMCKAIDSCHRVDEAKEIRDKAKALAVYAREAQNTEAESKAIQIRVRAEYRAGELLKLSKQNGQRDAGTGGDRKSHSRDARVKLDEIGITYDQSSDWQKLAEIPKAQFEETLQSQPRPSADSILLAVGKKPQPQIHFDRDALTAYGHIRRFEEIMQRPAAELFQLMQEFQQEHLKELVPEVILWLKEIQK